MLLALALPAAGRRRARLPAALAAPSVRRIALEQLSEAEAARAARRRSTPRPPRRSTATAAATRSTSSSSRAPATAGVAATLGGNGAASTRPASRRPSRRRSPRSSRRSRRTERALLEAAAVAGEPFEPDLAAAIAELPRRRRARRARRRCSRSTSCARRRCRAASSSATRSCAGPSTSRRAGGWRLAAHARAAAALAARGAARRRARAPRRAVGARQGDEEAIAVLLEAGRGGGAARAGRGGALVRGGAAAAADADARAPGRRARRARLGAALARRARALPRRRCSRRSSCCPPDAARRRVELTALCAAVEHWLGRHDDAHRRLARAWDELPGPRRRAAAAALQIELAVDGLYELDFEQTREMGRGALGDRAARRRPRADRGGRVGAVPRRGGRGRASTAAREHREEALEPRSTGCPTPSSRRGSRRSTTSAGPRPTSSATTTRSRTLDRGIAIARATGEGRLLVPLMLGKGYPFEMQGRLAEAIEMLRDGGRGRAAVGQPALPLLGAVRARLGALLRRRPRRRDRGRARRARASAAAWPAARSRGGRRPGLGARRRAVRARARSSAARELMLELGGEDLARTMPVERCFDWESLALVELAAGQHRGGRRATRARAEEDAARLGLQLPAALAARTRAAVLLAAGEPLEAARAGRRGRPRLPTAIGARLQAAFSRSARGPRARRGGRAHGRRSRRCARPSASSTRAARCACATRCAASCASSARAPRRAGRRPPATSGVASLTKRELEIADARRPTARRTARSPPRCSSARRRSSRTCATSSSSSASPRASRWRGRSSATGASASGAAGVTAAAPPLDPDAARLRGARLPRRSSTRAAARLRQRRARLRRDLAGRRALRRRARRHGRRRAGLGLGAAGRARRAVPAARRLRRAGLGVPDRRRRLPVEPPADRRRVRLVQRLGRDLRLRGGEHDGRLPRRAVGADAARDRADAQRDRGDRDGARGRLRGRRRARASTCSAARSRRGSRPRWSRRSGSGSRCCSPSASRTSRSSRDTLGAEALSGGSVGAGMLAALAVGGWVFIGFDACVGASEETQGRRAPRPAGDLDRAAQRRRARDPQRGRGRRSRTPTRPASSPGATSTRSRPRSSASFGSWSAKPFAAVVLVAFLACGMAAQALTARTIYSIARDGVLPGLALPAPVDRRQAPIGAIARDDGRRLPRPAARPRLGRGRQPDRVRHGGDLRRVPARRARRADRARARHLDARRARPARPRRARRSTRSPSPGSRSRRSTSPGRATSLAPPGAPGYQVWAAPLVLAVIAVVGLAVPR